ncbi:MAG: hypothetical protein BGO63_03600 [Candidatus Accumulibacter sp. 66-26]|nr:MAG: hypothetical protein BGO63_03600 [Candidatus Accumulibacter sp. 66-26]
MQNIFTAEGNRYLAAYERLMSRPTLQEDLNYLCHAIDAWCFNDGFNSARLLTLLDELDGDMGCLVSGLKSFFRWYGADTIDKHFWSDDAFTRGLPFAVGNQFNDVVNQAIAPMTQDEVSELAAATVVFSEKAGNIGRRTLDAVKFACQDMLVVPTLTSELMARVQNLDVVRPFDGSFYIEGYGATLIMPSLGGETALALSALAEELSQLSVSFPPLQRGNVVGFVSATYVADGSHSMYAFKIGGIRVEFDAGSIGMKQLREWKPELVASAAKEALMFAIESPRTIHVG